MYLDAMEQIGANRNQIDTLINLIQSRHGIEVCINKINVDNRVKDSWDSHSVLYKKTTCDRIRIYI